MNRKGKFTALLLLLAAVVFALGGCGVKAVPKHTEASLISYTGGEIEAFSDVGEAQNNACEDVAAAVTFGSRFWELFTGDEGADAEECSRDGRPSLIVGGAVFGTRIKESHIAVVTPDEGGIFKEGDRILSVNGKEVESISDVKNILRECGGQQLNIVCLRGGRSIALKYTPKEVSGEYKLGAVLREGAAGIGTVTYIDPKTGEFGGLGHGICDPDSGDIIEMSGGTVTDVILGGVVKGESGKPGELSGILTDRPIGEIYANTDSGVFGKLTQIPKGCGTLTPIAYRGEVHSGEAKILSTLKNGATLEYKVEISDVKSSSTGTKCFRVKVTDSALMAISGGIVRGMSGSPIIQDGKLVGAVTHVMVNDPTTGYGIFIENMLSAASEGARNELPKAA